MAKQTRADLEATLADEMKVLESQQNKVRRLRDRISKLAIAAMTAEPLTLEKAMVTYLDDGCTEFTAGHQYLNDLTYKGEWKDTGLMFSGSYWIETNQRCLKIALNHTWDDAKLEELAKLLEEVVPIVKPGVLKKGKTLKLMSKGSSVDAYDLRVFDIFEHELSRYASWKLGQMPDGEWAVFDARNIGYNWGRARIVGPLMECLQEIRQHLWYTGGPERDRFDDED